MHFANDTIGIALDVSDNVLMDDIEFTPLLITPIEVTRNLHGLVRFKICYDNHVRVHHFYGALTVASMIFPTHAGLPATIIITHSDIVKRMDRETQSALDCLLIQNLRVLNAELFKLLGIQTESLNQFAEHLNNTATTINFQLFTGRQGNFNGSIVIDVGGEGLESAQLVNGASQVILDRIVQTVQRVSLQS